MQYTKAGDYNLCMLTTGCPSPATGTAQDHFAFNTGGGLTPIPVCAVQGCASMARKVLKGFFAGLLL